MSYSHILVAIDLSPEAASLCGKALQLSESGKTRLSLLHVVEPIMAMPPYELPSAFPDGLEQQMVEQAKQRLDELGREFNISDWDLRVEIGATKSVILNHAQTDNVDLIIIGSHGRHGVSRLLGSTSNAILHHAECDVLAVRIGTENSTA